MALRNQPYIPLFVDDFTSDEKLRECSATATGILIRVMCLMHKSDEYGIILLKQNDQQTSSKIKNFALKLARHLPYPVDEIERGLEELISESVLNIENDKLMQKRMVRDNEISSKRSESGKKGGFASKFASANAQAKIEANTGMEWNIKEKGIIREKEKKEVKIQFEKFWSIYDKKVDRKICEKKWEKLSSKDQTDIIAYLPAYIKATPDKQFRKDPSTFLKNRSWENEIPEPQKKINNNQSKRQCRPMTMPY